MPSDNPAVAVTPFDPSDILTESVTESTFRVPRLSVLDDELAARLKVKKTFIYEKMRRAGLDGELPAMRVGKYLRFSWAAVSAWMRTQVVDTHTTRPYSRAKKKSAKKKAGRS
jgi:excisionase family DNA binding protein